MGQLAAQLERISVDVASPDRHIRAGVHGRLQLTPEFRQRSYGSYDASELGHQLGRLATLAWVRYHREYTEIEAAYLDWVRARPGRIGPQFRAGGGGTDRDRRLAR